MREKRGLGETIPDSMEIPKCIKASLTRSVMLKVMGRKTKKTIGEYFCIKGGAVSRVIKATEEKIVKDRFFRNQVEELKERILNVK